MQVWGDKTFIIGSYKSVIGTVRKTVPVFVTAVSGHENKRSVDDIDVDILDQKWAVI